MSLVGILASNFLASGVAQSHHSASGVAPKFQQIEAEFQQLGQDLQSGNLTQAQQDYTTLAKNLPALTQAQSTANPLVQAFHQLGQDLQAGNLQSAQKDYTTVQQDAHQSAAQVHGHHHRHHAEDSGESGANQQANSINQAFGQLAQSLQAGNLSAAQSAFATLQNDLQQIGGFLPAPSAGATGASGAGTQTTSGTLSVSA